MHQDRVRPDTTTDSGHENNQETRASSLSVTGAIDLIKQFGIDTGSWGLGASKSISDLLREIADGEARLIEHQGRLVREIEVVRIAVLFNDPIQGELLLLEDRQEMQDGRIRRRPTPWAIWEKRHKDEPLPELVERALHEELGLLNCAEIRATGEMLNQEAPMDYPGIPTIVKCFDFSMRLSSEQYNPAGYQESQPDKITVFHWQQIAPALALQSEVLMQENLTELNERLINEAARIHQLLLISAKEGFQGLLLSEDFTSGRIAEALTSFDGSSNYVRGALYSDVCRVARRDIDQKCPFEAELPQTLAHFKEFVDRHALPGECMIGTHAEINLPYGILLHLQIGDRKEIFLLPCGTDSEVAGEEFVEKVRVLASILTLRMLEEQLAVAARDTVASPALKNEASEVSDSITQVKLKTLEAWRVLESILKEREQMLVVGESFTFGKLAKLLGPHGSSEGRLAKAYGWYDPKFKVAVGVDPYCVRDDKIAEPETVLQGARGLLSLIAPEADIALGTSGWANYWKDGQADFFSVAAIGRNPDDAVVLKFQVDISKNYPRYFERRELTRELGVLASLTVLARLLARDLQSGQERAEVLTRDLEAELMKYGRVLS